jgi:hypothetical protein
LRDINPLLGKWLSQNILNNLFCSLSIPEADANKNSKTAPGEILTELCMESAPTNLAISHTVTELELTPIAPKWLRENWPNETTTNKAVTQALFSGAAHAAGTYAEGALL